MGKKIHLSIEDIKARIGKLSDEVELEENKANKTKRKRLYHQLANLRKALEDPDNHVVDPTEETNKIQVEKEKRIKKKLDKKKEIVTQIKKEKRHQKRCLKCGSRDHLLSECPTVLTKHKVEEKVGFCFKCGSKDHNHRECSEKQYKLANCFYCGKTGHIARQCPSNEKGLYRKGGCCHGCGSVRHTIKNCPQKNSEGFYRNTQEF